MALRRGETELIGKKLNIDKSIDYSKRENYGPSGCIDNCPGRGIFFPIDFTVLKTCLDVIRRE